MKRSALNLLHFILDWSVPGLDFVIYPDRETAHGRWLVQGSQ